MKKDAFLPVSIQEVPIELESHATKWLLLNGQSLWKKEIENRYPALLELTFGKEDLSEKSVNIFLKNVHAEQEQEISEKIKNLQQTWVEMGDIFLQTLSTVMEIEWPQGKKVTAFVSVLPVCPRDLRKWIFFIDIQASTEDALSIMHHEISHFLYFKKWKEVFPESDSKTFEYPHLEWHLSEILTPIILNDPRLQKLHHKKSAFYNQHKQLKIDSTPVPEYFEKLYDQHLKNQSSFDDFLKDAYREVKKIDEVLRV